MSIRIQNHVHAVTDPDGAVLLDVKNGKYFSLNGVGADIWEGLQGGLSVPEIEARIEREYGAPPERVKADVAAFLGRLHTEKLVHAAR